MKRCCTRIMFLVFPALWVALAAPMPSQAHLETYALATANGNYLSAFDGGGGIINIVRTDATVIGGRETFALIPQGGGKYALRTENGHYLTAVDGGGRSTDAVHTDATVIGPQETFILVPQGDGEYALQTFNGHYLTAVDGGGRTIDAVHTDATALGPWEKFTPVLVPQGLPAGLHPWTGIAKPGFTPLDTPTIAKLNRLRADIRKWAVLCNGSVSDTIWGNQRVGGYVCPSNETERVCDNVVNTTGDSTLYNGLMSLSGEESFFGVVKRAQEGDGRWLRSPDYVGLTCPPVSFSGDMAIGVLAYLAKTRDIDAAKRWWFYIEQNNGMLCPDDYTVSHDMCGIMAQYIPRQRFGWAWSTETFGTFRDVWESIGLTAEPDMNPPFPFSFSDPDADRATHACSIGSDPTWKVYNLAAKYLIKQFLNKETTVDQAGVQCLRRLMPDDPYIAFLAEGASAHAADLTLKTCSSGTNNNGDLLPWPDPDNHYKWMEYIDRNHWSWSGGWDCVFLVNLLIGPEPKLNLVLQLKPAADQGLFQIVLDGSPIGDPVGTFFTRINLSAGLHTVALQPSAGTMGINYITQIDGDCAQDGFVTLHPAEEKDCVVVIRNKNAPAILTIKTELIPHNDPGRFDISVDGVIRLSQAGNASTGPMRMSLGSHTVTLTASAGTDITKYKTDICSRDGTIRLAPGDEIICTIRNTLIKEPDPREVCLREYRQEYESCLALVGTPGAQTTAQCLKAFRESIALCRKPE